MILRTDDGQTIRITHIHYGNSPEDAYFQAGYWHDSDVPLSSEELEDLTNEYQDRLLEAWYEHQVAREEYYEDR